MRWLASSTVYCCRLAVCWLLSVIGESKLEIEIKTPHQEKCLQIVDMASWAIFRKWEHQDESYYNLIKSKIIEERPLFP